MLRRRHVPNAGRSTVPVNRQRWPRRLLPAAAISLLGLLLGVPGFARDSQGVIDAAQRPPPTAAPPPSAAPTRSLLDSAVRFDAAPGEHLDVAAALNRGARMFILQARYHDWGRGQDDYYLAGPTAVSRQALSGIFAPLAAWLAAPGHEAQVVVLALTTDPRSANPGRFDAACQAFKDSLGRYLVKSSDLPAVASIGAPAPAGAAALQSGPHVYTSWFECTGDQPPVAQPPPPVAGRSVAAANVSPDRWMADLSPIIGQRPLKQVVIPGSHDAGTYGNFPGSVPGFFEPTNNIAQAQGTDITGQLNAGSRYFDMRATFKDWGGNAGADYWNNHGSLISTDVRLRQMLDQAADWANKPGHEKEILVLQVSMDPNQDLNRAKGICQEFLQHAGSRVLLPSMMPGGVGVWDLSMNEIWALPNRPTIITNWDFCTGQAWPAAGDAGTPVDSFYANQCQASNYVGFPSLQGWPGIIWTLSNNGLPERRTAKDNPLGAAFGGGNPAQELPDKVVGGLYVLFTQATPTVDCFLQAVGYGLNYQYFYHANVDTLAAVQSWYTNNQFNAQQEPEHHRRRLCPCPPLLRHRRRSEPTGGGSDAGHEPGGR
jgi:hypothetical protein